MLKHETGNISVYYGESTQTWRHSRPKEHMAVMGKERRKDLNALRKRGWKPFLVTWTTMSHGAPKDLCMETEEWWLRTTRSQAVVGIWLRRDDVTIYYQLLERWVWPTIVRGCALSKGGAPTNIEAWLRLSDDVKAATKPRTY